VIYREATALPLRTRRGTDQHPDSRAVNRRHEATADPNVEAAVRKQLAHATVEFVHQPTGTRECPLGLQQIDGPGTIYDLTVMEHCLPCSFQPVV
jgi:hypothetical protein